MTVSRRLRFEILKRDGYACRYCGARAPDVELEIDHVTPTTLGGSSEPGNLVTACVDCNRGKSSVPPDAETVDDVAADALKWGLAMEKASLLALMETQLVESQLQRFDAIWRGWIVEFKDMPFPRQQDWRSSIERFLSLGLDMQTLERLVRVAMEKPGLVTDERWRYFCGCSWRTLSELQETARRILEAEEGNGT